MRYYIRRFEPLQFAKVMAALYFLMGLILLPIFLIVAMVNPEENGISVGFAVVIPLLYAVFGFIGTLIAAALYNLVAGWLGGIAVELDPGNAGP